MVVQVKVLVVVLVPWMVVVIIIQELVVVLVIRKRMEREAKAKVVASVCGEKIFNSLPR